MDENRVSGTAKNIGGKVEEGFGRFTGDTKTQAAGVAKQVGSQAVVFRCGRFTNYYSLAERVRQRTIVFLSTRPEDQPWYPPWRKAAIVPAPGR
jgi:hypothetical protein